jgi:hypothetical protein
LSFAAATALIDATMPQSQQFEALSHELFEMSSNSLNTFMGVPDFLTLPPNSTQYQSNNGGIQQIPFENSFSDINQSLALNTPSTGAPSGGNNISSSAYPSYQNTEGITNPNNVFDFFNVDSMQIGDQSNLQEWAWEGPSLFDMFDIVNPSAGANSHT